MCTCCALHSLVASAGHLVVAVSLIFGSLGDFVFVLYYSDQCHAFTLYPAICLVIVYRYKVSMVHARLR